MRLPLLAALLIFSAGCDLLPLGEDTPAPGEWELRQPTTTAVGPGALLQLHVSGVDVDPELLILWVDDRAWRPLRVMRDGPDDLRVIMPLPVMAAGEFLVAVGTEAEPKTARLRYQVTIPPRKHSQAEAARIWSQGLRAMAGMVRGEIDASDPEVREDFANALGPERFDGALAVLGEVDAYAATVEADYLALPDAEEAALQAYLVNSGLLPFMEALLESQATAKLAGRRAPIDLDDRLNHLFAKALWTLDGTAAALGGLSDAVSLASVVAVVFGGAGLSITAPAKITIIVIRLLLDSVIPTDVVGLELHGQPRLYRGEGGRWIYWGTFEPQNGPAATAVSFIDQVSSTALSEYQKALPSLRAVTDEAKKLTQALLTDVASRLVRFGWVNAIKLTDFLQSDRRVIRIKTIVNLQAYDLTVGDIATVIPFIGATIRAFSYLIGDWELVDAFTYEGRDVGNLDSTWSFNYATDTAGVENTSVPNEFVYDDRAHLKTSFYRFKNEFILIFNPPWLVWQAHETDFVVRSRPDPADLNETSADEIFVQPTFYPNAAIGHKENIVTSWDSDDRGRTIAFTMRDLLTDYTGPSKFDVLVNDALVYDDLVVPNVDTALFVSAKPGLNRITIRAVQGHAAGVSPGNKHAPVGLTFLYVSNASKQKPLYLDPGESYSVQVWVPPVF